MVFIILHVILEEKVDGKMIVYVPIWGFSKNARKFLEKRMLLQTDKQIFTCILFGLSKLHVIDKLESIYCMWFYVPILIFWQFARKWFAVALCRARKWPLDWGANEMSDEGSGWPLGNPEHSDPAGASVASGRGGPPVLSRN